MKAKDFFFFCDSDVVFVVIELFLVEASGSDLSTDKMKKETTYIVPADERLVVL